jgi:glycosyltransferase involved in cell wall biosynthesis
LELKSLKIAEVGERLTGTGAAEAIAALTALLRRDGHTVRLFGADSKNVPVDTEYEIFGEWSSQYEKVNAINSGRLPLSDRDHQVAQYHDERRQIHTRLIRELEAFDPDVVHFHNVSAVLSHVSAIAISSRWPLVWTAHARFPFHMFHNEWVVGSETIRSWEKTVAGTTAYLARDLLAASPVPIDFVSPSAWLEGIGMSSPLGPNHRFHMIRNVIWDVQPDGALSGTELRNAMGVGRLLLAVVPRTEYTLKGFDLTLEAFLRARAVLTFEESTRDQRLGLIVTTVKDLEMAQWGVFTLFDLHRLGMIDQNRYLSHSTMRDIYSAVDALVIASRAENFPNVAVEAIRDRCPVIATDVGGLGEIFTAGDVGRLVPAESVVDLAEAMVEVAVRRARESFEPDLQRLWEASFAPEIVLRQMEELFAKAIAGHPSAEVRRQSNGSKES